MICDNIQYETLDEATDRGSIFVPVAAGEKVTAWLPENKIEACLRDPVGVEGGLRKGFAPIDVLRDHTRAQDLIRWQLGKAVGCDEPTVASWFERATASRARRPKAR